MPTGCECTIPAHSLLNEAVLMCFKCCLLVMHLMSPTLAPHIERLNYFPCSSLVLTLFLSAFCVLMTPRIWMEICWTRGKEFGCSACGVWVTAGPSWHQTPTNAFVDTILRTWQTETCKSSPCLTWLSSFPTRSKTCIIVLESLFQFYHWQPINILWITQGCIGY